MLVALLLLFIAFLGGCSNSVNYSSEKESQLEIGLDSLEGMVRVKTGESVVRLGTNDELAKVNERPQMQVMLNYEFMMGEHEVTCGEFNDLMRKSIGLALECDGDSFPATNLTYYDAVLFANERSKLEKRDTVYTYVNAVFDSDRHCTNLEGFAFHPEVSAYRLPTEAEWVLVAGAFWKKSQAWTAENSGYKLHKVCALADSSNKICDMLGNAMEWVNDWLGNFRDTTVVNYVGSPDGGALGQRIVKGGSFRNTAESITLYGRGDVYTVTSSTRADYVGFRLAYGAIPEAVWMNSNGNALTSRIVPLTTSATLRQYTGTYRMKLAFRNDLSGNVAYIDYSSGALAVHEIVDTIDSYHPEISPDGRRVAFCTGLEGVSGKSSLYVRDLNATGTNLVKLDVESASIPRWRVRDNGDTVIVYVTDAGNNKNEAAFKSASTWQVKFANGKFGKPQKLFDGAFHGGVTEDGSLAVSGARLLRARVSEHDTVWYNDEQACNVSLSGDGSKRTLFLDFGGKTGREFAGQKYGTHERLLVADASGKLLQSVAAPAGYSFDHSEWVLGAKDLAVVTLTNANGAHTNVGLINLTDSSFVNLAEGDELWHPNLWVNQNSFAGEDVHLDLDSAGIYMNDGDDWGTALMRYNMELLWQYRDSVDVAVVGSSRPLYSLLPSLMSDRFFMVNFAQTPNSIHMSRDFLELYLFPHLKNLKYVVLSLDLDFWHKIDGAKSDNLFKNAYREHPGYVYDKNHNYWRDGYPEGLLECTKNYLDVKPYLLHEVDRGAILQPFCGGWANPPLIEGDSSGYDDEMYLYEKSYEALVDIIQSAQNRNIFVIGVIFPQNPGYKNTGTYGRYGMRRSTAQKYIARFEELEKLYPHFVFFDGNERKNISYSSEMFVDDDHLCIEGAKFFTGTIDSLLKTLE